MSPSNSSSSSWSNSKRMCAGKWGLRFVFAFALFVKLFVESAVEDDDEEDDDDDVFELMDDVVVVMVLLVFMWLDDDK